MDTAIQDLEKTEAEPIQILGEKERQIMPELPIATRVRNFEEVALGFTHEQAIAEANRCLDCRLPKCVEGCPVSVKIPDFIRLLKAGDPIAAGKLIKEDNSLPRVCGRVCPQADQCEGACVLGRRGKPIAIGSLERYVSDYLANHGEDNDGKKISTDLAPELLLASDQPVLAALVTSLGQVIL